ncbi:phage virion morphogenesis protein [uncultured Gimesia sp.]|uniref:phage virion morphogenesis protein n=1 Tax=uncultured Gimesia sp. TaxID=1678688 RepID=UPI0030D6D965|tara:strand:+ start:94946 stop:95404 length:459 start_codon:yes stop_codon:yes gene_type:complete
MSKTITIEELGDFLTGVVDSLEKPQAAGVLAEWNDELAGDLAESILSSKTPDGKGWAPLKYPRPKGHNQGTRPLIDTGALMRSVVSDGTGHIEIVTQDSTTFGTSIGYAGVHQFGLKKKNIPPRPLMGIPDKSLNTAEEMLSHHFITVIDAI